MQKTEEHPLLCIFSGENTNPTKDFSLVGFLSLGTYERLPPGGSWRRRRLRESALLWGQSKFQGTQAPSTAIAVPLPLGGRLF